MSFETKLPGVSQLTIELVDRDEYGKTIDQFAGKTAGTLLDEVRRGG